MNIYSITYDLKKPGQNYTGLSEELKKKDWWHYLDSTWLIHSSETANQIYERISQYLDENDQILINEFGNDYQGYLPSDAWNWIRDHKN